MGNRIKHSILGVRKRKAETLKNTREENKKHMGGAGDKKN